MQYLDVCNLILVSVQRGGLHGSILRYVLPCTSGMKSTWLRWYNWHMHTSYIMPTTYTCYPHLNMVIIAFYCIIYSIKLFWVTLDAKLPVVGTGGLLTAAPVRPGLASLSLTRLRS